MSKTSRTSNTERADDQALCKRTEERFNPLATAIAVPHQCGLNVFQDVQCSLFFAECD